MAADTEVTIIGASLAGSFAALLLARQGHRVVLIDPQDTPKSKACGEGLSLIGQKYLRRAGLWSDALKAAAAPFFGYEIVFSDGEKLTMSRRQLIGYAIRRRDLEHEIFSAAQVLPNLSVISDRVISYEKSDSGWSATTSGGRCIRSSQIIVASSLSGRRLDSQGNAIVKQKSKGRYAFAIRARGVWRERASQLVIIGQKEGHQFVLTPLSDDGINLCALVSGREAGIGAAPKEKLRENAIAFAAQCGFSITEIEDFRGASPVESSKMSAQVESVYYIGDAAELFDPISGMGMSHALFSASIAAEAVDRAIRSPESGAQCWTRYVTRRSRIASIFRIKTGLSFILNVKQSKLLRLITSTLPGFSLQVLCALEHVFPVSGLVNGTNRECSSVKVWSGDVQPVMHNLS